MNLPYWMLYYQGWNYAKYGFLHSVAQDSNWYDKKEFEAFAAGYWNRKHEEYYGTN